MNNISIKRNYTYSFISGIFGILSSILLNLASIPISLRYWKEDRYGIWVLLTSILLYLGMTNLGLNTAAAVLMAKNPKISDKITILTRSLLILLISTGFISVLFIALNFITQDWIYIIGKIPIGLKDETYFAAIVLFIFYLLSLPFSLLSSVYTGFQKVYLENVFNIALNVINFLVLIIVIYFNGNLIFYSTLWGISLVVFNIVKFLFFYYRIYRKIPKDLDVEDSCNSGELKYKSIFYTGIKFFLIGIASSIVWNTDFIVISNFISVEAVVPYSITFKLFSIVYGIIFQVNSSIMPLLAKEYGRNNFEWINRIYCSFLVLVAVLGGATWIGSILFYRDFITLWAGSSGYAGLYVVVALGGYSYLLGMSVLNSGIINSFNYSGKTPLVAWAEAMIKLFFSIWLAKIWGLAGVALGTFLGSLLSQTWALPILIKKNWYGRIFFDFSFLIKHFFLSILPCLIVGVLIQIFETTILIRLLLGVIITFIYLWLSYKFVPKMYRVFFYRQLSQIYYRFGFKSIRF